MIQTATESPRLPHSGDLHDLLERIHTLRHRARPRSETCPTPAWLRGLKGRPLGSAIQYAERRYPLAYALGGAAGVETRHLLMEQGCRKVFLSLQEIALDDGQPRLSGITLGWQEGRHFVIRQAVGTHPGAEAELLAWLEGELAECVLVIGDKKARTRARLMTARLRQGLSLMREPAWLEIGAGRSHLNTPMSWSAFTQQDEAAAEAGYRRQRDGLLTLARQIVAQAPTSMSLAAA